MAYPASVVSTDGNIAHIQSIVYYERTAIENLKGKTVTYLMAERRPIPKMNGKTMQFYENSILGPKTTPVSEGTPGAPSPHAGSVTGTVSISQYGDYMLFSDLVEMTAISKVREEQAEELGFQAARTVDTINYTQLDTTAAAVTAARIDLADSSAVAEYFSASVALRAKASLESVDAKPKSGSLFGGIFHPLQKYDYLNDNTAGGVRDILKYNDFGSLKSGLNDNFTLDGVYWISSTLVPTTANYGGGGQTAYHAYVFGKNSFFCTSLDFGKVPGEKNFRASISQFKEGESPSDPMGLISSAIWYKFIYATFVPPDAIPRFRRIRSEVSVT